MGLAIPVVTGLMFEHVIPARDFGQMTQLAIALMVVTVASLAMGVTQSFASVAMMTRVANHVQSAVMWRVINLPVNILNRFSAADLSIRAHAIDQLQKTVSSVVIDKLLTSAFGFVNFALLIYYAPKLASSR